MYQNVKQGTDSAMYAAHKKFMNSLGRCGYDPYSAIISTVHCQKTRLNKSAKWVLF